MARWNEQDSTNSMFLLGALAGALVGAGVALLMAPKTGAQVRRELNSGFTTVKDAAARRYRDVADKATQMYDEKVSRSATTAPDPFNGGATSSDSFTATPGTSGYQS
jgi:gas vesicle protein